MDLRDNWIIYQGLFFVDTFLMYVNYLDTIKIMQDGTLFDRISIIRLKSV